MITLSIIMKNNVFFITSAIFMVAVVSNVSAFINQNCDHKCVLAGNTYCGPIPCPYIPCDKPRVTTPGDCCEHCPTDKNDTVTKRSAAIFCPHPCTQGGQHYCHPIPCPLPPCDKPITTPGECCPHCPDDTELGRRAEAIQDCPYPCTQGGHHYCHPVPCPHPPCANPVTTPGECCPHCPGPEIGKRADSTTDCPHPCTVNGHHFCHPVPCPLPPCAVPVTAKGDCCPHCPNGPTCTYKGVTFPVGQTVNVGSLTCYCKAGGVMGLVDCV